MPNTNPMKTNLMITFPTTVECNPLQPLFNRTGLPQQVTVSTRLREAYRMPVELDRPEWVELAWVVNLILNRCLPAVELNSPRGRAWVAEFASVPVGGGETGKRPIAVLELDLATLHIALPEEICPVLKSILLVEDDPHLREIVGLFLVEAGILHEWACNGEEAWGKLHARPVLAVVTDVDMPGLSGLELCRRIKADPQLKSTPVLVMSGNPDYEKHAHTAGAAGFIAKHCLSHNNI